ncbi:CinA family protein [Mariniluteicoccus endophyticus]
MTSAEPPHGEAGEIAERVVARYNEVGLTFATVESLTGGLLGATITSVPGASSVYRGGLITYATDTKGTLAGVDASTLAEHGAVAEPTAAQMAAGGVRRLEADVAVALTGVAGPDPQEGHAPGTVFVGCAGPRGVEVSRLALSGDRDDIRRAAVAAALERLLAATEYSTARGH